MSLPLCRNGILTALLALFCCFAIAGETADGNSADSSQSPSEHSDGAPVSRDVLQDVSQDVSPTSQASDSTSRNPQFRLKDDVQTGPGNPEGQSIITLLFGLFAVLGAIFALAWLSKRFKLNLPGTASNMKLLGAMNVGAKEKLLLVEVEGNKLLLGVTPHQISLLKNFEQSEAKAVQGEFSDKMLKLLKAGAGDDH